MKFESSDHYIVRGNQPFRTLADMYFSIQNYAPQNPSPYDDTGWTFQYMRDIRITPVSDKSLLDQQMTMLTADAKAPGGVEGTGGTLVVDHTADNYQEMLTWFATLMGDTFS